MIRACAVLLFSAAQGQDLFLAAAQPKPKKEQWDALTSLLKGWQFTTEYAITVGTAEHGNLFTYEGGNFTMKTRIPTGSTSKWPSAMMFAGLVDDGTIKSLDDPVSKYLKWWTTNSSDPRSLVTLRMLLSFTSGFGGGSPGEQMNTRAAREWRKRTGVPHRHPLKDDPPVMPDACNNTVGEISECARSIYEKVDLVGKPGEVYSYNSNHLQLAAGLAVAASGLNIEEVIQKYLLKPYGMTQSFYYGKCPDFASSLVTTATDYERFLQGVLGYSVLSRGMVDDSEKDYTPFLSDYYTLYGNYGFGHFLACFDSIAGFTAECREARVHMDPGAFGFIPLVDRKYNYYMQVVAAEIAPTGSYPLSGIPEYLAVALKPVVDGIMSKTPPSPYAYGLHTPDYLSLSVADVNYALNCKLHPESCA